ncbi:MAG: SGNH/GDSL hydrolase family protein [Vulcanimicrobiaceae bacterium]
MARSLTVFAKGNLDLRDSLHSLRLGGTLAWNGVNEIVRGRFPGYTIRVRHELHTRSDALLEAGGEIPADLEGRALPLEPYTAAVQFSRAIFEADADVYVLSIQADIMTALYRHNRHGYLFCPSNQETWQHPDREWLREQFTFLGMLDVDTSMHNLICIVERIRRTSRAPIVVYNVSSVVPGENVRCYADFPESLSARIRRFNLGLIDVSMRAGISIVDVDTIVARIGANRAKLDTLHLTANGCRHVARDFVETLEELDCFLATAG